MSTQPAPAMRMTADEFIDWDGGGHQGKLELVHGEVRAMSPASGTHALIQATVAHIIRTHLQARRLPCRVGTEAPVRPRILTQSNVRAPDIAVTCLPPTANERFFPDPVLIIEVLSPSNQRETYESISACATIPTLAEVAVIDSERVAAKVFRKSETDGWPLDGEVIGPGDVLRLDSIGFAVPLAELYADTHLRQEGA